MLQLISSSTLPHTEAQRILIEKNAGILQALTRTQTITYADTETNLPFSASCLVGNLKLIIPLPQELKEREKIRLTKERDKIIAQQNQLRTQLGNTEFLEKAPPHLIEKLKLNLTQSEKELSETLAKLEQLLS